MLDRKLPKDAGPADIQGAAGGFLRRLEYQQDVVGEILEIFVDPLGEGQKHCHMPVMPAGVHFSRMDGTEGKAGFFLDGQGVHIAAEGGGGRLACVKKGEDRVSARLDDPAAQAGQLRKNIGPGFGQLVAQLRDTVQRTAVGG